MTSTPTLNDAALAAAPRVTEGTFEGMDWRLSQGTGEGCVVMVNGVGMDMSHWLPTYVQIFAAAGQSVLTFNHESVDDPALVKAFTVEGYARQTRALLAHLGIERPTLVGTSMGAFVSQEVARVIDVNALVLLGTYAECGPLQRRLMEAESAIYDTGAEVPKAYMVAMDLMQGCSRAQLLNDASYDKMFQSFFATTDYDDLTRRAGFFAASAYGPGLDHLRAVRCPTLVVGFEEDILTPAHRCRAVAEAIDGAEYVEMPGTGHFGALTRGKELAPRILDFLARRGTPPGR